MAERAVVQANKFGACLTIGTQVISLTFESGGPVIHLDGDEKVTAKCLLIATGADYRLLDVEGCERFEGCGVYYAATPNEALMCRGSDVVVVGGGNSAGQAAVFLSSQVRKVYLVVRGDSLYKDMSSYLAQRIEETPNIEVLLNTEVRRMHGENFLTSIELVNNKTGEARTIADPGAVQLHRGRPADRLAAQRRSRGTRRDLSGRGCGLLTVGAFAGRQRATVPAGDQPARRFRGRRRAIRLDQTRRLGGRRGGDGGPVRARIPQVQWILITTDENASYSPTLEQTTPSPVAPCHPAWHRTVVSRYQSRSVARCPSP